jgi:hypothetical protein
LLDGELSEVFPVSTFSYTVEAFCEIVIPQLRWQGRRFLLREGRTSLFYVLDEDETLSSVYASCNWGGRKTISIYPFNSFELNPGQHLFTPSTLLS